MNLFSRFFKKQADKEQASDPCSNSSLTFAQLNIPFKLFEGPVDQASEYCGLTTCSLCGQQQHSFDMGIGCQIIVTCSACGNENGLDAYDRENGTCPQCDSNVPFPDFDDDQIKVCYDCLRAGKAAITKDTELGMISWEQAIEGITHGLPGLNHHDLKWFKVKAAGSGLVCHRMSCSRCCVHRRTAVSKVRNGNSAVSSRWCLLVSGAVRSSHAAPQTVMGSGSSSRSYRAQFPVYGKTAFTTSRVCMSFAAHCASVSQRIGI